MLILQAEFAYLMAKHLETSWRFRALWHRKHNSPKQCSPRTKARFPCWAFCYGKEGKTSDASRCVPTKCIVDILLNSLPQAHISPCQSGKAAWKPSCLLDFSISHKIRHRFSPDYAPYGQDSWPGGLAHSAFNSSKIEPYTGRLDISDYLEDLQLPQMLDLAELYDTEIMVRFCSLMKSTIA